VAHTPEHRSTLALCGAKKRNGDACRAFAGQGTEHPGTGRCKFHGGCTPSHDKRAIALNLKRQMVMLGEPVEGVTAIDALLSELYASTGHVAWLRQQISAMSEADLAMPEGVAIVHLYDGERDRKARYAKLCLEAGVDEANIRVKEHEVTILGSALARAADVAGLSPAVKRRLGSALRDELAQAQPQPALAA
jgi:hypothetical protein